MDILADRITNLTDARYFAAKEVKWLAFHLEEGCENYLDPIFLTAMREWIEGPKVIGVFQNSKAEVVIESAHFLKLDAVKIPITLFEMQPEKWQNTPILVEITIEKVENSVEEVLEKINLLTKVVEGVIINFDAQQLPWHELSTRAIEWQKVFSHNKVLLNLNFNIHELPEIMNFLAPKGLVLSGSEEEKVGMKSFDDLDEIFEAISFGNS